MLSALLLNVAYSVQCGVHGTRNALETVQPTRDHRLPGPQAAQEMPDTGGTILISDQDMR